MLGLAASHLGLSTGVDYSSQALSHRVAAINRLNDALSVPCSTRDEGDARYATTMVLTFQSSYMPDGMNDFIRMMRGCAVVARTAVIPPFEHGQFSIMSQQNHVDAAKSHLASIREMHLDRELIEGYLGAVRALAPLCLSVAEVAYLAAIERTMKVAQQCPTKGAFVLAGTPHHGIAS